MNEETRDNETSQLQAQTDAVVDLLDRGSYERAIAEVRQLMDEYPDQAQPYALMGDIYAARNMWPEAVEWYHEAAERGDRSAANKLREARTQLQQQLEQPGQPRRDTSATGAGQDHTKLWITLATAGAVVVIAAVIAGLTLFTGPTEKTSGSEQEPAPSGYGPPVAARSGRTGSRRTGGNAAELTPPSTPSARLPTGSGTVPTPGRTSATTAGVASPWQQEETTTTVIKGPRTDRDLIIESALGSLTWLNGTAMRNKVAVAMDPFLGYAMITFEIPRDLKAHDLPGTVARQAYSIAAAAINTDPTLKVMTLRGVIDLSASKSRERMVVAYRGNTSRESVEYWLAGDRSPTAQQLWTQAFATTWWNPAIPRSGVE